MSRWRVILLVVIAFIGGCALCVLSPLLAHAGIMPPPATGVHRVVILVAHYADEQHPMDGAESIALEIREFFLRGSYGALTMQVDLFGPYTIAMHSGGCDYRTIGNQTLAAAVKAGVDLSPYTHKVYSFPYSPSCPWFGWAAGGNPSTAYVMGGFAPSFYAHELGHNLGLPHSHAMRADGTTLESGDRTDTMGSGGGQPFNAISKMRLGWIAPRVVSASGAYTLKTFDTHPDALRIVPLAGGDVLSVVLRHPASFHGTPGVIIHKHRGGQSYLLDMSPPDSFADSALLAGQSWTDPTSGITLAAVAVSPTAATVSVTVPAGPPPPPPPPPPLPSADASRVCIRTGRGAEVCEVEAGPYRCLRQTGGRRFVAIEQLDGSSHIQATVLNPKPGAEYVLRCQVTATSVLLRLDGVVRLAVNR